MEDILQSIKAFLYDRASSPLFGAFIISWAVWNYRLIVILLSGETYIVKFNSIDQHIKTYVLTLPCSDIAVGFYVTSGIVFPLLTALAYIYIYPYAAEPVYKYSLKKQKDIRKLKKEANDSKIIDEKESRKLFKNLADMQNKYDTDISQYQKQVESLRTIIDEKKETLDENNLGSSEDVFPKDDLIDAKAEKKLEIKLFRSQFETFLRKLEAEWSTERDSEPHNIEDAKFIMDAAVDEVLSFQAQITNDPNGELLPLFTLAIKNMKALKRHTLTMDGGKSFKSFWRKGESIIEILNAIPQKLSGNKNEK